MDGYTLTEKMRAARRRFRLTATEQALFYELVAICNSEGWEIVFRCSNLELCLSLGGVDVKTLIRARTSLINARLIYYKSGKSKKDVGTYSFDENLISGNIPPNYPMDTPPNTPVNVPPNPPPNPPMKTPNLYKTKTEIKTKEEKLKKEYSFVDNAFEKSFIDWLEYKRERKEAYKSRKSEEACYKKLLALSGNNPKVAAEIVEQSMANNWAGLFELTNRDKKTNFTNHDNNKQYPDF